MLPQIDMQSTEEPIGLLRRSERALKPVAEAFMEGVRLSVAGL